MQPAHTIAPCLWFDDRGEEAAEFYTAIFPDSRIVAVTRYSDAGREIHGREPGSVMTVEFVLNGQGFTALNGGPHFKFNEAASFQVPCDTQAELDHYWERLSEGGDPKAQQCGWLKDKFGVSWQVVPRHGRDAQGPRVRGGAAGDGGRPADEEARPRRDPEGLRGVTPPRAVGRGCGRFPSTPGG
jgi:predicted 3-demethylubiquinone-9 3-methyltransferase (glyoxalase superfamily)